MKICYKCGCTDDKACVSADGITCYWVADDLCSECVANVEEVPALNHKAFKTDKSALVDHLQKERLKNTVSMKKISIASGQIMEPLKKLKEVIAANPPKPILSNVLLKVSKSTMLMVVCDLIVTMEASVDIVNDHDADYEYLVPFAYFYEICEHISLEGMTIEFKTVAKKGSSATVTTLTASFDIKGLEDTKEWPAMPEFPEANSVGIGGDFIECINKAISTTAKKSTNAALEKIFLKIGGGSLTMASCNAFCIYEKSSVTSESGVAEMLINIKIAKALKGLEETTISWSDSHVAFVSNAYRIIGLLQDEKFPDYTRYFSTAGEPNFTISLEEFKDVIGKVSLTEKPATIFFKREIGHVVVESENTDKYGKALARMPYDFKGDCEKIIITPAVVQLLLSQVKYTTLNLSITGEKEPIVITTPSDPSYRSLLMPRG